MNNIDYTKLGAIGAQAAYAAAKKAGKKAAWLMAVHDGLEGTQIGFAAFRGDEPARTAYAEAVVRAYLEQVGEGLPTLEQCEHAYRYCSGKHADALTAVGNLYLAAFAKKLEEGTGAWASIAAENLTIAQAKLEAVAKLPERWRADQNGPQSVITVHGCAYEVEKTLCLPAAEVEPAEKWAKEKSAFAQGAEIQYMSKSSGFRTWLSTNAPAWEEGWEYRIAPDQTAQPSKLTDEELGRIGAKAAFDNRSFPSSYLCIDRGNAQWSKEQDGRNAYARAVREAVEKQRGEEIARLIQSATKAWEEADRAKSKIAELTQGIQDQQENADRLMELDATNRENCDRTHRALVESQLQHLETQKALATVTAERDRLQWRPVSVKPTREDADLNSNVIATNGTQFAKFNFADFSHMSGHWTHWIAFSPPPTPTPEEVERERFEKWAQDKPHLALNRGNGFTEYFSSTTQSAWIGWQAACAVKEGE